MKFARLDLIKWGHFSGASLDLSGGPGVVQVVYGANEAGKSTALRALRAALYGIETRSTDNFLHPYEELRIGALLRQPDGTEIEFVRRKGTRNTFLDRAGNPVADGALRHALSSVDESLFGSLFGIDHARLVAGGQGILRGGGDVGESLFAAGFGGASLRGVLEKLDAEAAELFRPQGQNQAINRGCREYAEAKKEIGANSLASREYEERVSAFEAARQELRGAGEALKILRSETIRLERRARALPLVPQRRRLLEELGQLGAVPFLPERFSQERVAASTSLASARAQAAASREKMTELDARIAGLSVPEVVLGRGEIITEMHQRLGSHRQAAHDLPGLQAELRGFEKEIARLLADLKLERPEASQLSRASQRKIQALANRHQAVFAALEGSVRTVENQSRDLVALREKPPAQPEVAVLRDAAGEALRQGDLEEDLARQREALRLAEAAAAAALKRLGLWRGDLAELQNFAAPSLETIGRFEQRWSDTERGKAEATTRRHEAERAAAERAREIDELIRAGSVPTETELTEARARREENWRAMRRAWSKAAARAEAYEADVQRADELADRLRREAERVARHAHLAAERGHFAQTAVQLRAEIADHEKSQLQCREEWRALWHPVEPLPPPEMRAWLQKWERLLDLARERQARLEAVNATSERIAQHRAALQAHLGLAGDRPLRALLAEAQRAIEQADAVARDGEKLTGDLRRASAEQASARAVVEKWQEDWRGALGEIGRAETTHPDEASDFISDCAELQKKLGEAERLRLRLGAMQTEADHFAKEADALFAQLEPGGAAGSAAERVGDLYAQLTQARRDDATWAALRKQRDEAAAELESAERTVAAEEFRLAEMCRQAGCSEPAELDAIEHRTREVQARRSKLAQLDERLLGESGGAPLEAFIAEIDAVNGDALAAEIAENLRGIAEGEEARSKIAERVGREELLLQAMDGNARAAEAAENAQAVIGEIEEHSERYIRLRLAAAILRREIERYRSENQDPLLRRAGEFFRELTLGSFTAVATDFDAGDNPILRGVRPSGVQVAVEGMSEGTRDQLFLALQLASVEKFIGSCGPMPFIVDDVLIAFDQAREAAVLRVLADLAKATQVIVFTHHRHLVELAEQTLGGAVQIRDLAALAGK